MVSLYNSGVDLVFLRYFQSRQKLLFSKKKVETRIVFYFLCSSFCFQLTFYIYCILIKTIYWPSQYSQTKNYKKILTFILLFRKNYRRYYQKTQIGYKNMHRYSVFRLKKERFSCSSRYRKANRGRSSAPLPRNYPTNLQLTLN